MSALFTCTALLVAIALIAVGATAVRKANPTSGYLFIAAGAVMFLMRCCLGFSSMESMLRAGVDYELVQMVMVVKTLLGAGEVMLIAILLASALATLAKKV